MYVTTKCVKFNKYDIEYTEDQGLSTFFRHESQVFLKRDERENGILLWQNRSDHQEEFTS